MQQKKNDTDDTTQSELESLRDERELTIFEEFFVFLKENKKWWLLPILIMFGLISILAVLSSTGVAPFIYPL